MLRSGKKVQWSHQYMKTTQLRVHWSSWQWSLLIDFSSVLTLSVSIIRRVEFFHSLKKHFATPPLVPSRIDVRETSAVIPYWSRFWLVETNFQPIRSTTQIWVVTGHQCGIAALFPQTSFREEISGGVAKCRLFSQAIFFFKGKLNMYLLRTSAIFIALFTNASSHGCGYFRILCFMNSVIHLAARPASQTNKLEVYYWRS